MPEHQRPLKVFLSYASQDKPVVLELSRRLASEGWIDPWVDEKKLLPGQDWRTKIEEAVETSDIVIICLSSNSIGKEGYVQKELRYAREIALEKLEETIFLIPLRLDECDVPRGLRFYQWADYFGENKEETYDALLESLKLRHEQKLKSEAEERTRWEKEERDRKAAEAQVRIEGEEKGRQEAEERTRREKERKAAEIAAQEKRKREIVEKAKREKTEREAAEKIARQKIRRDAAEKAKRERAERQSAQLATLKEAFSNFFISLKPALPKAIPSLRIAGFAGIAIVLFWAGSWGIPKLISLAPTVKASLTPTLHPSATVTLIPPTKTLVPTATRTRMPTATSRPATFSIYDDFSFGSSSKKFDAALWNDLGGNATITWQNGYLVFSGTDGGHDLQARAPKIWRISQIGKLQADLRIDSVGGGYGFAKFSTGTTLSDGEGIWWAQCRAGSFDGKEAEIICDSYRWDNGPPLAYTVSYQTTSYAIEFGKFYKVSIEIAPDASYVRYYVDDKQIGSFQPKEKDLLVNSNFDLSIGLWMDEGVTATGAVDNVMVGN